MKNSRRLARLALLCFAFATVVAALVGCDQVAASCPAGAALVAGIRGVVGALNNLVNASSTSCATTPTVTPGTGIQSTQVQVCAAGQACGKVDVCEAAAGDTSCNACVKTSCCAQAVAFAADPIAPCLVGCQMGGATLDACAAADQCDGQPDAAYDALAMCVSDHCATPCADLRLQ